MNTIFYAPKSAFSTSEKMIETVLRSYFNLFDYKIVKDGNGKPFLEFVNKDNRLFISVTHTNDYYFIAFCNENVGIDAEKIDRTPNYSSILSKFPIEEREQIATSVDFLKFWTTKESAIKWLGGTIAHDLKNISYLNGKLSYRGLELPVRIFQTEFLAHIVCVCS